MVSEYRIDNRFEGEMQGLHKPYEEFVACEMRLSTWFKELDDTDIYEIVALQQAEADLTFGDEKQKLWKVLPQAFLVCCYNCWYPCWLTCIR